MRRKITVTPHEYSELQRLALIINDRSAPLGQRKIAKAEYDAILRLARNRPTAAVKAFV